MRTILGLLLSMAAFAVAANTPLPDGPHIVVTGEGKVTVTPDSARVRVGFEQRASQPLPAKQTVDRQVNALLAGSERFGIAEADIHASDLSVNEDVDYDDKDRRISNGHVAGRSVSVVLKDLERLNEFLDFCLAAGASDISQVSFESSRAAELRAEAKREAVASAREKGEEMASAFGTRLGQVYSIDSLNSRLSNGWSATTLDSIQVSGSRSENGRYLQPTVDYSESVHAVFELIR
ncbi:MAG TPA: SIMPL domain-containing protein [Pseudoxanthomonas sp.]|nr:SIMPL domain-containing protein [Pseudoxanthomonas sp.]